MNMEKTFETLQKLQEILSEKYMVEQAILAIPKSLETKMEILNRLKQTYVDKNDESEKTKTEIKQLTFEMGEAERHREESEQHMDEITTQREYEALDKEIRDATEKEQRFRREIQKKEWELEEMQLSLDAEENMIKMQEEELEAEKSSVSEQTTIKQKQLDGLIKKEESISKGMDESLMFKFQRIIKNKSGIGIVPVKSNICSGCQMVLPAQFVNLVRSNEDVCFCPYCSRILYWGEEDKHHAKVLESNDDVGGLADIVDSDNDDF